ncbi:amidase [Candidatus Latescibacterota bacterium]
MAPSSPTDQELVELTLAEMHQQLASGEVTARALAEAYLRRVESIDRSGPATGAIIEINPEALDIAQSLDRERREGGVRGPLHGIPIVLKDNIDTADQMQTSAGSLALVGSTPSRDSAVAARLRQAGAVLLAKANLSEWANFRSTRSTSGWSARGGQTRNPYVLDRNPCGSSSGSAVATSANLCAAAIGTETDGSIVCPSNANGIVGIKPTVGLVSRAGIVPISHTQDTAGPMARTVADAAAVLGALTGEDPADPITAESGGHRHEDYTRFLDPAGLKGARIGVARSYFGFHDRVDALMEEALEAMRHLGAEIVDPTDIATKGQSGDSEYEVLLYEFKADLNAYLSTRPDLPYQTLADLIAYNEAHRPEEMPHFGQEIFVQAQEKGPLTEEAYLKALADCRRLSRDEGIDATLREHDVVALVAPTGGPAWLTDLVNGDSFLGGCSSAAAVSGYPHITVPAGFVHGLPVGISFFGAAYSEPTLIRLAHAFEQATQHRRPPAYLPTADLSAQG